MATQQDLEAICGGLREVDALAHAAVAAISDARSSARALDHATALAHVLKDHVIALLDEVYTLLEGNGDSR